MNVNVNQAWRNYPAFGIDDRFSGSGDFADLCDFSVGNKHIAFFVNAVRRVYHATVFY
jgi:hypothetical protein